MRRLLPVVVLAALAPVAVVGCLPSSPTNVPVPSPNPDAGQPLSFDACGMLCWKLRSWSCVEGKLGACETACHKYEEDDLPTGAPCLLGAANVLEARGCNAGVECLP